MRQPVYFISHGGGPWPWMAEAREAYGPLSAALSAIPGTLPARPDAILMVSAHWMTPGGVRVGSHPHPGMVYDYYGFPAHTYQIRYPAPGDPALAGRVLELLGAGGIPAEAEAQRGYDHGAFVPAYVMAPEADIPMVQLSIEADFDPARHIALGRALAPLRGENILIVGSGLSYHNLRRLGPDGAEPSAQFDAWLQSVLIDGPADRREAALCAWEQAPAARIAHPQEDHLIPLHLALGAAGGDAATCFHHETRAFGGITVSSFRFG
ncbi:class III extradiol ring-cleavage dioxygenase [Castellaniella sp. GW247-6E4]|uniref:DODA-type extradiol aromatic ring-opening family dioxygenase n=1 Tax=Castellaniella sp. GW247-6E4 TaxID=3140380 RepID=UPI0033159860